MSFWVQKKVSYHFRKGDNILRFLGNGQKSPNKFEKTQVSLEQPNRTFFSAIEN